MRKCNAQNEKEWLASGEEEEWLASGEEEEEKGQGKASRSTAATHRYGDDGGGDQQPQPQRLVEGVVLKELVAGLLGHAVADGLGSSGQQRPLLLRKTATRDNIGRGSEEEGVVVLCEDFGPLCPPEREYVSRLCRLGTRYAYLWSFVQGHRDGHYLSAFKQAIGQILSCYRERVVQLEWEALHSAQPLLFSSLWCRLLPFEEVLEALSQTVEELSQQADSSNSGIDRNVHRHNYTHNKEGVAVLQILYKKYQQCGKANLSCMFGRLLGRCHAILLHHMLAWMETGRVIDRSHEFFIVTESSPSPSSSSSSHHDDSFHSRVEVSLLPSYLSVELANKVLWTGQVAQMFASQLDDDAVEEEMSALRQEIYRLASLDSLDLLCLQDVVDKFHGLVAKRLWKCLWFEHNVMDHLHALKAYFLFGKGELYHFFLREVESFSFLASAGASTLPAKLIERDLNVAFAIANSTTNTGISNKKEEKVFSRFRLRWRPTEKEENKNSKRKKDQQQNEERWETSLSMKYIVDIVDKSHSLNHGSWSPLNLFFSPSTMQSYNDLFRFLLTVMRVNMELLDVWKELKQTKARASETSHMACLLNHKLICFANSLQYYLQDLVTAHFRRLAEKISAPTQDFAGAMLAHQTFLSALEKESFLTNKATYRCFCQLFHLAHRFCGMYKQSTATQESLYSLGKDYDRTFSLLTTVLRGHSSQHASRFLLRLSVTS
ncbi:Gamma-tubulin complex component 4 [Balamuthia mandrillaris]